MYCVNRNSSWYIDRCLLYWQGPLLGVSVIGGSTVLVVDLEYYVCIVHLMNDIQSHAQAYSTLTRNDVISIQLVFSFVLQVYKHQQCTVLLLSR